MSLLCLTNNGERYLISAELWTDLLCWAEEAGWCPADCPETFRQVGLTVNEADAADLADVFEVMAGHLIFVQADVSDAFLRELGLALESLAAFFDSGTFRICAANCDLPNATRVDPTHPL